MSAIKDKLDKISVKQKTIALAFVPFLMMAAFVYFYYLPARAQKSKLVAEIQTNQSEIAKSQVMERKLSELKEANRKLQEDFKVATELLPGSDEKTKLLDRINEMVKESGLQLKTWTPGAPQQDPSGLFTRTAIAVEVVGSYHDVGKFMEKLDGITRVLNVSDLTMSSAKLAGKKMDIPVKFTVVAYSAAGGK